MGLNPAIVVTIVGCIVHAFMISYGIHSYIVAYSQSSTSVAYSNYIDKLILE